MKFVEEQTSTVLRTKVLKVAKIILKSALVLLCFVLFFAAVVLINVSAGEEGEAFGEGILTTPPATKITWGSEQQGGGRLLFNGATTERAKHYQQDRKHQPHISHLKLLESQRVGWMGLS